MRLLLKMLIKHEYVWPGLKPHISHFYMSVPLKQHHSGRHFTTLADVGGEVRLWMAGQSRDFYCEDVDILVTC